MRIPSQFNEDSLYRRGKHPEESAQSYRRLARLLIGLALVIVVMRQASKPAMYRTFFGPQAASVGEADASPMAGSGAGSAAGVGSAASAGSDNSGVAANIAEVTISPDDRRIANSLTEPLSPADQRQWIFGLSRWQAGQSIDNAALSLPTVLDQLSTLESISDEQRLSWQVMLESFQKWTENEFDAPPAPSSIGLPRVAAFLAALDDAAASRVVDGSVWRSGDFDAFYRYLDRANGLSATGIAMTGTLPLLQQPDVFRNQRVRVQGGVARTERIQARDNPYGITEYWQLWLRPSDGADRPLVAIVPRVPELVEAVGEDAIAQQGPQVAIVGTYLKRLAYESAMGADLAPVVIGRIVSAPSSEPPPIQETSGDEPFLGRLWLTVALSSLVGFALAAITMWRTTVMARRSRELRTANRKGPDDFLKELGSSADHAQ